MISNVEPTSILPSISECTHSTASNSGLEPATMCISLRFIVIFFALEEIKRLAGGAEPGAVDFGAVIIHLRAVFELNQAGTACPDRLEIGIN